MIRTGLRTLKEYVSKTVASTQSRAFLLVAFVSIVTIFGVTRGAHALDLGAGDWLLGQLGIILGTIIDFLGKMVVLLSNILIDIASYNNFVHAKPVEIGWVLIRDVVNMFFIVVLLVSAFSTIIGYEEFKYTKVLPKLLLMAVLINFSKTLIGLLIDFSQVLMLTFVNAFKPAAGGNFISLFKLTKMVNMKANEIPELSELLVASMLAILMLSIVMTILIIMIGFLLYRIIGLWMILIMSPLAFFALALPGKISGALSIFTKDFWSKLSTFLVAGPVMAFFIWMALAMAQGGSAFGELTTRTNTETESVNGFISAIGSVENMGGFIVAVAFLLTGVQFAMSTANSVSPMLGKLGKAVGGASALGAVPFLARGLYRGGRLAGRAAGTAATGTYRTADVISGRRLSAGVGSAVSGIGKAALKINPAGLGEASFVQMATYNKKRLQKKSAEREKNLAPLDAGARDAYNRRASSAWNVERKQFATMSLAETATTGPGLKARTKAFEEELKKANPNMTPADLAALATAQARQQAANDIANGKSLAETIGDGAAVTRFKEALEKDPGLHTDLTELAGIKGSAPTDIKRYIDKIPDKAMQDGAVAIAHMKALGMIGDDGKVIRDESNADAWKAMEKGTRGKYLKAHLDAYASPGHENDVQNILNAIDGKPVDKEAIDATRHYAAMKGGVVGSAFASAPVAADIKQTFNVRNEEAVEAGKDRLTGMRSNSVAMNSPQAVEAKSGMVGAGALLAEAFAFNPQGGFENAQEREAFEKVMDQADAKMKGGSDTDLQWIASMDTASLHRNIGAYNEAREAAVSKADLDSLKSAMQTAVEKGNTAAQSKIKELADAVVKEGNRNEQLMKKASISQEQIVQVAVNPTAPASVTIIKQMEDAGVVNPVLASQAVSKAMEMKNPQYSALRSSVGERAATRVGAAGSAVKEKAGSMRENRKNKKQAGFDKKVERMGEALERKADEDARRKNQDTNKT